MTVYVDDFRVQARVGRLNARWSHLTVGPDDDIEELHRFAVGIGLRRSWFQGPPKHRHPHYDVTDSKRQQAIAAGAVAITWREAGQMLADAGLRRRAIVAATQRTAAALSPAARSDLEDQAARYLSLDAESPASPAGNAEARRGVAQ
jgi:hypothetical protein